MATVRADSGCPPWQLTVRTRARRAALFRRCERVELRVRRRVTRAPGSNQPTLRPSVASTLMFHCEVSAMMPAHPAARAGLRPRRRVGSLSRPSASGPRRDGLRTGSPGFAICAPCRMLINDASPHDRQLEEPPARPAPKPVVVATGRRRGDTDELDDDLASVCSRPPGAVIRRERLGGFCPLPAVRPCVSPLPPPPGNIRGTAAPGCAAIPQPHCHPDLPISLAAALPPTYSPLTALEPAPCSCPSSCSSS